MNNSLHLLKIIDNRKTKNTKPTQQKETKIVTKATTTTAAGETTAAQKQTPQKQKQSQEIRQQ